MITTYINRYGDEIIFEHTEPNKIEMSGYDDHLRAGWPNDYSEAYKKYLTYCSHLEEIDYNYLVDDPILNVTRELSEKEFETAVLQAFHVKEHPLYQFTQYIKSDKSQYDMVDPSGGPYISRGMNIGRYFDGKIGKQIVEKIEFGNNKIIFTTKNEDN
jgi:hypothetical protein